MPSVERLHAHTRIAGVISRQRSKQTKKHRCTSTYTNAEKWRRLNCIYNLLCGRRDSSKQNYRMTDRQTDRLTDRQMNERTNSNDKRLFSSGISTYDDCVYRPRARQTHLGCTLPAVSYKKTPPRRKCQNHKRATSRTDNRARKCCTANSSRICFSCSQWLEARLLSSPS